MNRYSFNDDIGSIKMCRISEIPADSIVFFSPDTSGFSRRCSIM